MARTVRIMWLGLEIFVAGLPPLPIQMYHCMYKSAKTVEYINRIKVDLNSTLKVDLNSTLKVD